ncbi:MAG TPA: DUF1223 domain-containing protein [Casimicrobiaceae bacterium]|nr:DUF1223 domain-containing protein [Casimicrobiaceae bacterium]
MNATRRLKIGILAVAAIAAWPVMASPVAGNAICHAASPSYTLALLELYTSEGCDSCPPADRWFSALDLGPAATRAAAVAFHVDYWDRLGWRDRFGSADYTARQNDQKWRHHTAFVYTPQVLLQGEEFTAWHSGGQPTAALSAINARPARASIELATARIDGAKIGVDVHVRIPGAPDREHAEVTVAMVQNGLASNVKAGENKGKHLVHDHVVRAWRSGLAVGASGELRQQVVLPLPDEGGAVEIVAWAEDAASGEVLQALSLAPCDN